MSGVAADDLSHTGLLHLGGVETQLPDGAFREPHRVLVGPEHRLQCKHQIATLDSLGYRGPVSFEPFAPSAQAMAPPALREALAKSIAYVCEAETA